MTRIKPPALPENATIAVVAPSGPTQTRSELEQAFDDYRRTQFAGWPWPENAPVHDRDAGRFAKHTDGRVEQGR